MNPYQVVSMDPTVVATPTATPTATSTGPTPTATPTATVTPTNTATGTPTATPTGGWTIDHSVQAGPDSGSATLPFTPGKAGDCLVFTAWSNGGTSSSPSIAPISDPINGSYEN